MIRSSVGKLRGSVVAVLGAVALLTTFATPAAAAEPGDGIDVQHATTGDEATGTASPAGEVITKAAICDIGIICGSIKNDGGLTIRVTTKYISPTSTGAGAHTMNVLPGGRATAMGAEYDWDAFWVPNGYCGASEGGMFWNSYSTMNNVGRTTGYGTWKKVDDFGAAVKLQKGGCPLSWR